MDISREELEKRAKEINDSVFGPDRKQKRKLMDALKEQVNASAKFALGKALSIPGVSPTARAAFLAVLKEQKDAVNILMLPREKQEKAVDMLKPIFGQKSAAFVQAFREAFTQIQSEIQHDRKSLEAG